MVTFITSDGEEVQVQEAIATEVEILSEYYDDNLDRPEVENAAPFPLPNVDSRTLRIISVLLRGKLEFDSKIEALEREEQEFKAEFFGRQNDETIVELVKAADYLRIEKLLDFMMLSVRKKFTYGGSSSSNPRRMVTFITSDGEEVQVPVAIATEFEIVSNYYDDNLDSPEVENAAPFPLPNVDSRTLRIISVLLRGKLEFDSKIEALEKEEQEFKAEFFGRQTDGETIVELVKAADYLRIEKLLDFMMPSVRKRSGLGDDKGVDFVYTAEAEAILFRRAATASVGAGS